MAEKEKSSQIVLQQLFILFNNLHLSFSAKEPILLTAFCTFKCLYHSTAQRSMTLMRCRKGAIVGTIYNFLLLSIKAAIFVSRSLLPYLLSPSFPALPLQVFSLTTLDIAAVMNFILIAINFCVRVYCVDIYGWSQHNDPLAYGV